jgi:hypothetical protein
MTMGTSLLPTRRGRRWLAVAALAFYAGALPASARALSTEVKAALETSPYVYISSHRKDGSFGAPAEIWFMYHDGAVWVASPTTTWRVRRIRAGRTKARIAVGKPDGPTFAAVGSIVTDPALHQAMFGTFARKYPQGWPKYEDRFRQGLVDGTRVMVKYQPAE